MIFYPLICRTRNHTSRQLNWGRQLFVVVDLWYAQSHSDIGKTSIEGHHRLLEVPILESNHLSRSPHQLSFPQIVRRVDLLNWQTINFCQVFSDFVLCHFWHHPKGGSRRLSCGCILSGNQKHGHVWHPHAELFGDIGNHFYCPCYFHGASRSSMMGDK